MPGPPWECIFHLSLVYISFVFSLSFSLPYSFADREGGEGEASLRPQGPVESRRGLPDGERN